MKNYIYLALCILVIYLTLYTLFLNSHHIETFMTTIDKNNSSIPLTNNGESNNVCGPLARCSITNQQCLSDIDCKYSRHNISENDVNISMLEYKLGVHVKPQKYNKGIITWASQYNLGNEMFNNKMGNTNPYVKYPINYTITGDFTNQLPPAYNS